MVQNIRENVKQSDGSYVTKHRETNASIVLYDTGEIGEDSSPIQTNIQNEIDEIKNNMSTAGTPMLYQDAEPTDNLTPGMVWIE